MAAEAPQSIKRTKLLEDRSQMARRVIVSSPLVEPLEAAVFDVGQRQVATVVHLDGRTETLWVHWFAARLENATERGYLCRKGAKAKMENARLFIQMEKNVKHETTKLHLKDRGEFLIQIVPV